MRAVIEISNNSVAMQPVADARQITVEMVIGNIINGKSAYRYAVEGGYAGSESSFYRALGEQTVFETIAGVTVELNMRGGHTYLCGELTALTISSVEDSPREAVIRFRSGATATTLSVPNSLRKQGYWGIAPKTDYEINIADNLALLAYFTQQ